MKLTFKNCFFSHRFLIYSLVLFSIFLTSCSLLKIESAQTPLEKTDLNTRILTQTFAKEAMNRIEYAADSIQNLEYDNTDVQINTLIWRIKTSRELGRLSFQTEPRIALLDTWSYFIEVKSALDNPELDGFFGEHEVIATNAIDKNIIEIETIASHVMSKNEFKKIKKFVEDYAMSTPILSQKKFRHQTIRPAYLDFKKIPDSLAYQTVGSLSEVVADASNRFGYISDATSKRISWNTEKMLLERGIDSLDIQAKMAEFDRQVERLLTVAENAPEDIDEAIKEFHDNISPLFRSLNYEIRNSMESLSENITKVDSILLRERVVLDSIVKRERMALSVKADELVETGIENAFEGLSKTIRNLIIYFILLILVLFGIPFYMGYLIGKRKGKNEK